MFPRKNKPAARSGQRRERKILTMGIHVKLTIPAVAAFLVFAAILHFYWAPRFYDHARAEFINGMMSELAVLENDLARHLASGDYSALYASLQYQEKLHDKSWKYLILFDEDQKQIYPLDLLNPEETDGMRDFDILLEHRIEFKDIVFGRIELGANWFERYVQESRRITELEMYLFVSLAVLFLTQLYWEYRAISRPISDLNRATERLAQGIFQPSFPRPPGMRSGG